MALINDSLLKDKKGTIRGIRTIIQDITERKLVEEKLRESEERYRCLVEVSPDTIAVHADVKLVDRQPCRRQAFHAHDKSELIGKPGPEIIHPTGQGIGTSADHGHDGLQQSTDYDRGKICMSGWNSRRCGSRIRSNHLQWNGSDAGHSTQYYRSQTCGRRTKHSEEMFRGVISAVPVGIGIVSNREVQWVNDSLLQFIGREKEEIIKNNTRILYTTDEMYNKVGKQFYDDLREKRRANIEVDWKHKDGSTLNIFLTGRAVDQQDISRGIVIAALDITERKRAEEELKESEERYRRLVEYSPDAIAVHSESTIRYVNPAAVTLLGASNASELIGKPFLDIIHPDFRDSVHKQIISVLKEELCPAIDRAKIHPAGRICRRCRSCFYADCL